jgi:hypothetical protein
LDLDATLVTCHPKKEQAAAICKRGFGFHPLLCFLDNTGEALAGLLRPHHPPPPMPRPGTGNRARRVAVATDTVGTRPGITVRVRGLESLPVTFDPAH